MYKLEINIAAYDKADLINMLQYLHNKIRYENEIFFHYADDESNEYMSMQIYNVNDKYDDIKFIEKYVVEEPIYDDWEKNLNYYYLTKILGYSDEDARKECDELF